MLMSARSHFSVGESLLKPGDIPALAAGSGHTAVVLTDTMSITGLYDLCKAAKKEGIKAVIGCRVRVVDDPTLRMSNKDKKLAKISDNTWYPKLYAKNAQGLKDIMQLLTLANSPEYFYFVPRVHLMDVVRTVENGNVALSTGDVLSVFHHAEHMRLLRVLKTALSGSDLRIELCPINTPLFDTLNKKALKAAEELDVPLMCGYPTYYANTDDADTLDVSNAIANRHKMSSQWRNQLYTRDFAVEPYANLETRIKDMLTRIGSEPSTLLRAGIFAGNQALIDSCSYIFEEMPVCLPKMASDEVATLITLIKDGWKKRFTTHVLGYKPDAADMPIYHARLKYELSVLQKMHFEGYFLLVENLVRWSKDNGIMVGPGRGSIGGSLVAYLLGITDVDPIRFDLLFERFINPERIDLPDADLDFMSSRRHEIIDYLKDKYGEENVAGISNYNTLASASAIRDTGSAFDLSPEQMSCTKLMPKEHGINLKIEEAAKLVPEIEKFKAEQPVVWRHALKLDGILRTFGKHAAGVIVGGEPLINRAVIENRSGDRVVNWDRNSVEKFGLIKFDVLGLSTLDVIKLATDAIEKRHKTKIDVLKLPLDDERTLKAFGEGKTIGVFQFESCLAGDSMVDGVSIKERFERQTIGDTLRTLDEGNCSVTPGKIRKIVYSGKKTVYSLKLKNGQIIKATADHRFYSDGEWIRLGDLIIGNRVLAVESKDGSEQ